MWESWVNLLVAVWLISKGIRHQPSPGTLLVAGIIVTTFGFWIAATRYRGPGVMTCLLGVWLFAGAVVSPWMPPSAYFASGFALAALAMWDLAAHHHRWAPPADEEVAESIFKV